MSTEICASTLPHAALDQALAQMRQHLRSRRDATRRRALADYVSADQIEAFLDYLDAEDGRIIAIAERCLRPLCQH
jgi:hypothetical protein